MVLALKDTADFKIPTKNIVDNDANFNYATVGGINAYDRTYLDIINANRTFFFPPANVLIERSTDSGSTWTTVNTSTYTTQQRGNLMCGIGASLGIGTGNAATTQQLRITLQYPGNGWYCSLDRAYIRWNIAGHSNNVTIQASTYGAQSTYTDIVSNQAVNGWPGDNMIKFSRRTAWGTNSSAHLYNIRFIFKYSSVNSSYIAQQSQVIKISLFGMDFWGTTGTPRYAGHLYNWDYLQNVTFPAKVTSTNFTAPRFTATGSTYPHIAGNGSDLTMSATGGWSAGTGALALSTTDFRPSTTENGNIDLGSSTGRWKNLYLSGNISNGTYTYTLPSKSGTVALTSDTPPLPDNIAYIGSEVAGGGALIQTADIADGAITPAKLGDTGWIDASSQAGLNRCFYRKVGNIVYIILESAGNKTIGASYTTVFTLPVGFRPSIDWNFVWQNISNADSRQNGWIKTSGTIELYSNTSKNYWYGSTSFPVD